MKDGRSNAKRNHGDRATRFRIPAFIKTIKVWTRMSPYRRRLGPQADHGVECWDQQNKASQFERDAKPQSPAANAEDETSTTPTALPHAPSAAHLALITERETTSNAYKKAQTAEKQYRTRRQATRARHQYTAAKTHLKTAYKEFGSGVKASVSVLGLLHYVLKDKVSATPEDKQKRKLERTASKRQKLEAKMKKIEDEDNKAKEAEGKSAE